MNHKKLFMRFVRQPAEEQGNALVHAFLEHDDEAAEIVCKYDIPEFTGLICKSDSLAIKPFAEKYISIMPLYKGMAIVEYIDTVFAYHATEIIPLLDLYFLKELLVAYEERCELIQDLYRQKQDWKDRLDKQNEEINKQRAEGKEPGKKAMAKIAAMENRMRKIASFISLLKTSWVKPFDICELLKKHITEYPETQNAKLDALLSDPSLGEHYAAFRSAANATSEAADVVALQERIRTLEAELSDMRNHCAGMHTKVSNLQADKHDADAKIEKYEDMISRLQDDNGELKSNCDAYHSILMGLSSKIANAVCKPLAEIERMIYEIEDSSMTPSDIANWLKEPVSQLRENFINIPLNASGFDNLPAEYVIAIDSVDPDDNWGNRIPVPYNEALHTCKVSVSEFVCLRNRGFVYENNLGQEKTIKADAIPCESPAVSTTGHLDGDN